MKTKVKCPYSEKCIDVDKKCNSCLNNEKRSYYRPESYYYPYCQPFYQWTWTIPSISIGNDTITGTYNT